VIVEQAITVAFGKGECRKLLQETLTYSATGLFCFK